MKRKVLLFLIGVFTLTSLSSCGYNTIVEKEEKVEASWAQVENVYQRRADLIPNLVKTVKGAADFERETLQNVIEARSKATSINVKADELTQENLQKFNKAQQQLGGALSRLLVSVERYPNLKANQNFLELQSQLEGTENRISVERRKFNESVRDYNSTIRKFPTNIVANLFNFEKKAYFESEVGAEEPPEVEF